MRAGRLRALWAAICLSFFALSCSAATLHAAEAPPVTVDVTLPWLSEMARFIVGSTMQVRPLTAWDAQKGTKALRRVEKDALIIALDPKDGARHGVTKGRKGLHMLYDNLPLPDARRNALPFDPSILPFLSQRLLIALSEISPENYPFYQRRLAEFQSRMESTREVGRSLIRDVGILDLSGAVNPWVAAAAGNCVRPPDELWRAWSQGARLPELTLAAKEAEKRGWWILLDGWTPAPIRSRIMGAHRNVFIDLPPPNMDFFDYLHDIYLKIWSASTKAKQSENGA